MPFFKSYPGQLLIVRASLCLRANPNKSACIELHLMTFPKKYTLKERKDGAGAIGSLGGERFSVRYFASNSYLQLAAAPVIGSITPHLFALHAIPIPAP